MNDSQIVQVMPDNKMASKDENKMAAKEEMYSINKELEFQLSYGVTKLSISGFYTSKLRSKSLAFYNDLSLKKIFDTQNVSGSLNNSYLFRHLNSNVSCMERIKVTWPLCMCSLGAREMRYPDTIFSRN